MHQGWPNIHTFFSTEKQTSKTRGGMGRETCTWSVLNFVFLSVAGREKGEAVGKGKWRRQVHPPRLADCAVQKEFRHFSAKVQPQELPEQPKLRVEATPRERLVRHFPVNDRPTDSPARKRHRPVRIIPHCGTVPTMSLTPAPTLLLHLSSVPCTQFTVPGWHQRCNFFFFPFFLALNWLFQQKLLLRNGMCGRATLPVPKVNLHTILF